MIENYKKGGCVVITHKKQNYTDTLQSVGIIFDITENTITLAQNFSKNTPVDIVTIGKGNILKSEIITPKEVNFMGDLHK